jgi:hypothetical protein
MHGNCGDQSGTWEGFLPVLRFPLPIIHSTNCYNLPSIIIIIIIITTTTTTTTTTTITGTTALCEPWPSSWISEQFNFYGVRLSASRPTPNLEDQGIPLRLAPTP